MTDELVTVGRLGRTRGVQGELYIVPFTDFPDRFLGLNDIFVRLKDGWKKVSIESTRMIAGKPVVKFTGIDSPEDARSMTNRDLAVPKDELVELPEGSYFVFDLIGCQVLDAESNEVIGELIDVEQYPASDVYLIKTDQEEMIRVPAVKAFIRHVDIKKKTVTIDRAGLISE